MWYFANIVYIFLLKDGLYCQMRPNPRNACSLVLMKSTKKKLLINKVILRNYRCHLNLNKALKPTTLVLSENASPPKWPDIIEKYN